MIIRPEIFTTPDCPTVKFREAFENVDLSVEIPKLLVGQGWGLGTVFSVQFITNDRIKLIKVARFIVTSEDESLNTSNADGYQPMTKLIYTREAKQIEKWFWPEGDPAENISERFVKWNVGAGKFQVLDGDTVLFSDVDKEKAEAFRDAVDTA